MIRPLVLLFAPLAAFAAVALPTASGPKDAQAPRAKDRTAFGQAVLPTFTPEGYRSMLWRGSMDLSQNEQQAVMTDMQLTVFSGDAAERIESILISPEATVRFKEEVASGDKSVRYVGDQFDAAAVHWTYNRKEKSISLKEKVQVTFKAELKDLLR